MNREFAARNQEEAQLIAEILGSHFSKDALAKYANWLSIQGLSGADYIRHLSTDMVPEGMTANCSASWFHLFGTNQPWAKLRSEAPNELIAALDKWVQPIVVLSAESSPDEDLSLRCSKFCGDPDLPPTLDWPTCELGPLHFQVQINLADIRLSQAALRYSLPESGLLLLFAFDDPDEGIQPGVMEKNDETGEWAEIEGLSRLIYVPESASIERRTPPESVCAPDGPWSCRLRFSEALDLPWAADTEDLRLHTYADLIEGYRGSAMWESKMFGYPMHGRTDNTSPGPAWMNLFTLGSIDAAGWSWCDGEHLDVYVHNDGIRSGRFEPSYAYAA